MEAVGTFIDPPAFGLPATVPGAWLMVRRTQLAGSVVALLVSFWSLHSVLRLCLVCSFALRLPRCLETMDIQQILAPLEFLLEPGALVRSVLRPSVCVRLAN